MAVELIATEEPLCIEQYFLYFTPLYCIDPE